MTRIAIPASLTALLGLGLWCFPCSASGATTGEDYFGTLTEPSPGIRSSDWFGFFTTESFPWVYHFHHGWLYCWDGPLQGDTRFLYDRELGWLYTTASIYPFLYDFELRGWIWYFRESSNPRWFSELTTGNLFDSNTPPPPPFQMGVPAVYTVPTTANGTVTDPEVGVTLRFPSGGSGTVSVAPITDGPAAPFAETATTKRFSVEATETNVVNLAWPVPSDGGAVQLYAFGKAEDFFIISEELGEGWFPLPMVEITNGQAVFRLPVSPIAAPLAAADLHRPRARIPRAQRFTAVVHNGNGTYAQRTTQLRQMVNDAIDQYLAQMHVDLARTIRQRIREDQDYAFQLQPIANDDWRGNENVSSYFGLNRGLLGVTRVCLFSFVQSANLDNVAHEVGHYLQHVANGDDAYQALQEPLYTTVPDAEYAQHALGVVFAPRRIYLEEFAYLSVIFLTDDLYNYDPFNPWNAVGLYRDRWPETVDFVSMEGFFAQLIANLVRTDPQITHFYNRNSQIQQAIPAVNASWDDVLSFFEGSRLQPAQFVSFAEQICTAYGYENALPAIAQRLGWRHMIRGVLANGYDFPLRGFSITPVCPVGFQLDGNADFDPLRPDNPGVTIYDGGPAGLDSNANGAFTASSVFPGRSLLRLTMGTATTYAWLDLGWANATDAVVDVGRLYVRHPLEVDWNWTFTAPDGQQFNDYETISILADGRAELDINESGDGLFTIESFTANGWTLTKEYTEERIYGVIGEDDVYHTVAYDTEISFRLEGAFITPNRMEGTLHFVLQGLDGKGQPETISENYNFLAIHEFD